MLYTFDCVDKVLKVEKIALISQWAVKNYAPKKNIMVTL